MAKKKAAKKGKISKGSVALCSCGSGNKAADCCGC